METENEELMSSEAAARLGISPRALRIAIEEGRLAGRQRGRYWFIRVDDLEAYRARTQPAGEKSRGRPSGKSGQ